MPLASQIKGIASLQEDRGKVPRALAAGKLLTRFNRNHPFPLSNVRRNSAVFSCSILQPIWCITAR